MKTNTCCFIGHREIFADEQLKEKFFELVEKLITEENVDTFLFGSRSQFDAMAIETVTKIKEKFPHIKRVYVRAEYKYIDEKYKKYLLQTYDDTYYPEKIWNSGKSVYIERNYEMINNSDICIFYYDELISTVSCKSGTKIALEYAIKQRKSIINAAEL